MTTIFLFSSDFLSFNYKKYAFAGGITHKYGTTPLFIDRDGVYYEPSNQSHQFTNIPDRLERIGDENALIEDCKNCFKDEVIIRKGFFSLNHFTTK